MTTTSTSPADASRSAVGRVLFVGAGPGDPTLLTVRAVEVLQEADVIVYDTLVPGDILAAVGSRSECLPVPRESGDGSGDPGDATGRLLARLAAAGRTVVRLKGGDPTVFGRLSEEMAPVRAAGIPVEIVPGVTAAVAAAAAAGIPLTSRSAASSLTILTGHEAVDKRETIDFRSLASLPGTLAIYMGVEQVERWSQALLEAGRPADTPVTIVSHCSWPDQRVACSSLARCAADFARHSWTSPAVVIIGEVAQTPPAAVARGPLAGRRVLVTRPHGQGEDLVAAIRAAGGSCLHVPVIDIGPPPSWEPLDAAIRRADIFDWIVFASANGARSFVHRLRHARLDARALGTARLAAIGPATRAELEGAGLFCDLTPELFRSEAIAEALGMMTPPARFLIVRANRGRDVMRRHLEACGHEVTEVCGYASHPIESLPAAAAAAIAQAPVDWITVTSSLIAESAVRLFGSRISGWKVASLSPITSATLRECGVTPTVEAAAAVGESLVAAMADWERSRNTGCS
jgi:uroporphyrinogen III methyltransferase/synthase